MTPAEFEDAKTLWKFFYAHECFKQVENACSFIIDNSLDEKPSGVLSVDHGHIRALWKTVQEKRCRRYARAISCQPSSKNCTRSSWITEISSMHPPTPRALTWAAMARRTKSESWFHRWRLACSVHSFEPARPCYRRSWNSAGAMQKKANYHLEKLQKRHQKKVPEQLSE
jgi:hypothetical protein